MPGAAVQFGLGLVGIQQGRQQAKENRKARQIDNKRRRLEAQRSSIEQIRQGQIARAEIIAQGASAGAEGSSAVLGGAGAVQSQIGSNVAFSNQMAQLQQLAQQRLIKAQEFGFRSQALGQLTNMAGVFSPSMFSSGGTQPQGVAQPNNFSSTIG